MTLRSPGTSPPKPNTLSAAWHCQLLPPSWNAITSLLKILSLHLTYTLFKSPQFSVTATNFMTFTTAYTCWHHSDFYLSVSSHAHPVLYPSSPEFGTYFKFNPSEPQLFSPTQFFIPCFHPQWYHHPTSVTQMGVQPLPPTSSLLPTTKSCLILLPK